MSKFDQLKRMKPIKFVRVNLRLLARKTDIMHVAGAISIGAFMICTNVIALNVFAESANNVETPVITTTTVMKSGESLNVSKPVITELITGTTESTTTTTKITTLTTTKATTTKLITTKATTEEIVEEVVYEEEPVYEEAETYFEESEKVEEEPVYEEETVNENDDSTYSENSTSGYPALTASMGKNDYGPSGVEKWYDLPMPGVINYMKNDVGIDYEFWIRSDGVKMYGDYVIVAANLDYRPKGTIIETSLGTGMVCDYCEASYWGDPYLIDIAVDWKNWDGQ